MQIIPAIDLYNRKCVRLYQGDFENATLYEEDPIIVAQSYAKSGATTIHVVDLDGARYGKSKQIDTISAIKNNANVTLQMGGGIRTEEQVQAILKQGIDRVVIGSLAVKNKQLTQELLCTYGTDKIVLALDVAIKEEPYVVINGWQQSTHITLWSLLDDYKQFPGLQILCTDINRDGVMAGANIELYKQCIQRYPDMIFQASGGVGGLDDLKRLKAAGVKSIIVGKALYEKCFTLEQAFEELSDAC
jgi:phosphoribosylformimino-5-aminoimidazole carboxamide ribotide isomerase